MTSTSTVSLKHDAKAAYKRSSCRQRTQQYFVKTDRCGRERVYSRKVICIDEPKDFWSRTFCFDRHGNIYSGQESLFYVDATETFSGYSMSGVRSQEEIDRAIKCDYRLLDFEKDDVDLDMLGELIAGFVGDK